MNQWGKRRFVLLGLLLLCFLGTFYSPEFRDGTDSALEGPMGLTCWWNKSSRVQGGGKQNTKQREQWEERLGLLGILCVAFLEVTQVHWNESCKDKGTHDSSQWTGLVATSLCLCQNSQFRFGLGFFSTYSCGPRSFRSLVCVDRMSRSTHCQAEVGGEGKKQWIGTYRQTHVWKKARFSWYSLFEQCISNPSSSTGDKANSQDEAEPNYGKVGVVFNLYICIKEKTVDGRVRPTSSKAVVRRFYHSIMGFAFT